MHETIQKPIDEIVGYLKTGERVFVQLWHCVRQSDLVVRGPSAYPQARDGRRLARLHPLIVE